jgi:hypothetical protein
MGREEKPKLGWKAKREREKTLFTVATVLLHVAGLETDRPRGSEKISRRSDFFFFRRRRSFMRPFDAVGLVLWSHEFSYELLLFYFILFFLL